MKRKVPLVVTTLISALILSNCGIEDLNTINKLTENLKNLKEVTINVSSDDIENAKKLINDLEEVYLNGNKLSQEDYLTEDNKIKLKKVLPGKNIVEFKHKRYGEFDIPLEVKNGQENQFIYEPHFDESNLKEWEIGSDSDNDGNIDPRGYFSREVEKYVYVRDYNGENNYIPKDSFKRDFQQGKKYPKPEGFPENYNGNIGNSQMQPPQPPPPPPPKQPIFFKNDGNNNPDPIKPEGNYFEQNKQLFVPLPEKTISNYKIEGVILNSSPVPKSKYVVEKEHLILETDFIKQHNLVDKEIKMYLIDETGAGVLLTIFSGRPILNPIEERRPEKEIFIKKNDIKYFLQKNIQLDKKKFETYSNEYLKDSRIRPPKIQNIPPIPPDILRKYERKIIRPTENGYRDVELSENGEILGFKERREDYFPYQDGILPVESDDEI